MTNGRAKFKGQLGFTLMEVMVAMTIFAIFATAFLTTQGNNIQTSGIVEEESVMHRLAERQLALAIIDPPQFTNATANTSKTNNIDVEGFKEYKYTLEYKKVEFPSFENFIPQSEDPLQQDSNQAMKKRIFLKLKQNIERMLWQVRITITSPNLDVPYTLSTWITNQEAQIDANFGI